MLSRRGSGVKCCRPEKTYRASQEIDDEVRYLSNVIAR